MASIKGIFQPIIPDATKHSDELTSVLSYDSITLASAFVTFHGVNCIFDQLKEKGDSVTFFAGIRNDMTSFQGLQKILEAGCKLYVIDTGTSIEIFHGKIYLGSDANKSNVIVGSANSTFNGLNNSLEISANIHLDHNIKADKEYLDSINNYFMILKTTYADNCFEITTEDACIELLKDGLLVDERRKVRNTSTSLSSKNKTPKIRKINLPKVHPKGSIPQSPIAGGAALPPVSKASKVNYGELLYTKKEFTTRDAQLTGGKASGDINLTQSGFKVDDKLIDMVTFFRESVFKDLTWSVERSRKSSREVAWGRFALVIDGVSYGTFLLMVSHKLTRASNQRNYVTGIHWGNMRDYSRKEEFIGKKMNIYRSESKNSDYVLEITD